MLIISVVVVTIFHNRFWAAADEGNYAHVAERLLSGETLNRDVQDLHAGYVDFTNAAAFSIFGLRLVSLRYPLAILTVLQAGLMFLILRSRGLIPAAVASLALTSLTFVQFLNPTANWYCLFFVIATIGWLWWVPLGRRGRNLGTGFLIGTTFLFRQLSGGFLGMGVLAFLLLERRESAVAGRPDLARALLAVEALALAAYLAGATDVVGWLLFGLWPFPILLHAWRRSTVANKELATVLLALSLGAALSALPLVAYHLAHHSVGPWLRDSFEVAATLPSLPFMKSHGYGLIGFLTLRGMSSGDIAARLNAVFWLGLLFLAAGMGMLLLRSLVTGSDKAGVHPLPVIASFYALVSLHYQLPIYLFCSVGLTLAAVLWLTSESGKVGRLFVPSAALFLSAVGLYYQAAMPVSRRLEGIVAGQRRFPDTPLQSPVAGLYVDRDDAVRYHKLVDLIQRQTSPGDTIFTLPTNAELYFLGRRINRFRFHNTAVGIRSSADLDSVLQVIRCHPPKLVFYDPTDKYNTPASVRIAGTLGTRYEKLAPVPPFQVFRARNDSLAVMEENHGCESSGAAGG